MKLLNYYGDVVGDYICLCAYMLLVNFSYMLLVLI